MSNDQTVTAEDKNYSVVQVAFLRDNAPWNLEKAKAFEEEVGHGWRSIIAKCGTEKIQYDAKPPPTKKVAKVTKAELVAMVAKRLDRDLSGLEKAPAIAIVNLINGLDHITKAIEASE